MNNRTAHIQFKVILDKNAQGVAFGGAPAFLPQEIDLFLNQGQDEIISNKISGNNVLKVGFEGSQQRISELDALVRTDKNVTANRSEFNEFVLDNVHKDGERLPHICSASVVRFLCSPTYTSLIQTTLKLIDSSIRTFILSCFQ